MTQGAEKAQARQVSTGTLAYFGNRKFLLQLIPEESHIRHSNRTL
jgi:hypothetical protein